MEITITTEKTLEETISLLKSNTIPMKFYHKFPIAIFGTDIFLAGKITGNKICLLHPITARISSFLRRSFYGEFIEVDNKTVIKGKFKFSPPVIAYEVFVLGAAAAFILRPFSQNLKQALLALIMLVLFVACCLIRGALRGRKHEKRLIEEVKKILSA